MNNKTKKKIVVWVSAIFFIVINFISVKHLDYDFYFSPVWTKEINLDIELKSLIDNPQDNHGPLEAFILGNNFGYFNDDGSVLISSKTDNFVSLSNLAWIEYSNKASQLNLYSPDGNLITSIDDLGFLHLVEDRIYIFHPGGDSVSQYSEDGVKIWTKEYVTPITAFNSSQSGTVIGYADGKLIAVDNNGNEILSFFPSGSTYPIILGAAISNDASLVACVSGINQQRFILIRIHKNQHKVILHSYLESNARRQLFVKFNNTGKFLLFECENDLGVVNCQNKKITFTPINGKIINAEQSKFNNFIMLLLKNQNTYHLAALELPNHLLASTQINAEEAFLIQRNNSFYLGTDNNISKIDIKGIK